MHGVPLVNIYWVRLTCDHDVLVAAENTDEARRLAAIEAEDHFVDAAVDPDEKIEAVDLSRSGVIALVDMVG